MQFQTRHSQPPLGSSWGGLETLVVQSVGGNIEVDANEDASGTHLGQHPEEN
jgi:hypothetical protein